MSNLVALINDSHFGVRGDSPVFLNFQEKFYKEVFFPKIDELGITNIIHLGDFLDRRKFINFITYSRTKEIFLEPVKERGLKVNLILGNHDIPYKNTNVLNSPTLLLKEYSDNINIIENPTDVVINNQTVACVPWINQQNEKETMEYIEKTESLLLMGHLEINGFVMHVGRVAEHGLERNLFDKFDMVLSGHFHHRSTDGRIYYLGSQYEMTWADFGDQKGFHIIDLDTMDLGFVPNHNKMFHRIVYNDKLPIEKDLEKYRGVYVKVVIEKKTNEKKFESFMQALYNVNPFDLKVVENYVDVSEIPDDVSFDQSEHTLSLLNTFIEHATITSDIDKGLLKNLMVEIYNESLNMEG